MKPEEIEPLDRSKPLDIDENSMKRYMGLLNHQISHEGFSLSPLQTKLLQICKALLFCPKLLVIDSSFFVTEEVYQRMFYSLLFKNLPDTAIVAIPDNSTYIDLYFDRCVMLNEGAMV